jgi:hypothetical protein
VQSEHTKQVALLSAQSKLKKVESEVFNNGRLVQKYLLPQTGHINSCPFTAMVKGSGLQNSFIFLSVILFTTDILRCHLWKLYRKFLQTKMTE